MTSLLTIRGRCLQKDAFALVDPAVKPQFAPAVARVTAALGAPRNVTVASEGFLPQWFQIFRLLQGAEAWAEHGAWIERFKPRLGLASRKGLRGPRRSLTAKSGR